MEAYFNHLLNIYYAPYKHIFSIFGLVLMILFTALAQFMYKIYTNKQNASTSTTNKNRFLLFLTIGFFASTPFCGYLALKIISIDIVSMASALILVIITILSHFYFHEKLKRNETLGILLIITGIIGYFL